ncbi:MAG: VWA domain-containing protein [Pseudomonadota bacterium]
MIKSFLKSRQGNIAMMFGAFCIPMVAAAGLGIDFAQSSFARTQITEAADAAVLSAARAKLNDKTLSDAALSTIARKTFDANASNIAGSAIDTFDLKPDGDGFSVTVTGGYDTMFMGVVGYDEIPFDVFAQVQSAPPRALEAVLVLDNTGSMSGAKLTTLKDASQKLIDEVMTDDSNVKIGVVPFSNYVNVGLSRRHETWIDVPADKSGTNYNCWNTYPDRTKTNCETVSKTCSSTNDGVKKTWPCTKQECDVNNGDPVKKCANQTWTQKWKGCVGSRNAPNDVKDEYYAASPVPGLLNVSCAQELLPLTSVKSSIEKKLTSMKASGETYIPAGLSWGLRLISSQEPFAEGATYEAIKSDGGTKALILMTDGENTKSSKYPKHDGSNTSSANAKTEDLCKEVKGKGIELYTIAFEVTDKTTRNLLGNCATSPDYYFNAENPDKLVKAFEEIATSLKELALTK